jgi:hypothetical protein
MGFEEGDRFRHGLEHAEGLGFEDEGDPLAGVALDAHQRRDSGRNQSRSAWPTAAAGSGRHGA